MNGTDMDINGLEADVPFVHRPPPPPLSFPHDLYFSACAPLAEG